MPRATNPIPNVQHRYKQVEFRRTDTNVWTFEKPTSGWDYWRQYTTPDELHLLTNPDSDYFRCLMTMYAIIDRQVEGTPH